MNELNNTINKLEFIFGALYSSMEINITDNTTFSKSEISGFLAISEDIVKELRDTGKTLVSVQK